MMRIKAVPLLDICTKKRQKMHKVFMLPFFAVLAAFILSGCSSLEIKDDTEATLNPSKIHEECMELQRGDVLFYSFKASGPVAFNIHFHEGENISYPVSRKNITSYEGKYSPAKEQMCCLMWTNVQKTAVQLSYIFRVEKK
jgi:hypothetical protein